MSTANLDAADLKAVALGGLIAEDVMARIWDISRIPLPFTDRVGDGTATAPYHEWTKDKLGAVDLTNARVDGADAGANQATTGARVGNHAQLSDKVVKVSDRAQAVGTLGFADALAYQLMMRQQELYRDLEAIAIGGQASIADDGNTTAGKSGGLASWIETNYYPGASPGAAGGFNSTTGVVDARVAGDGRGLTETQVRTAALAAWTQGSNPNVLMSVPQVIANLSRYMFTSSAAIATLTRETRGDTVGATALGSVNVFITDFGVTLDLVPNRLQQTYNSGDTVPAPVADVFVLDTSLLSYAFLWRVQTAPLARTGTADNRQMSAHWTLVVGNEEGLACIADILPGTAVVA